MVAFRENEARQRGHEDACRRLIPIEGNLATRRRARETLDELIRELGPVIESYPTWHPIVSRVDRYSTSSSPSRDNGYDGLDHTVFFAHGFVTCPYGNGTDVISSVKAMRHQNGGTLEAEKIEAPLYSENTATIVVRCRWEDDLTEDLYVPTRTALGLMLEHELRMWKRAKASESWERMRGYILGAPHGARSSLFVTQDTAVAMKRVWGALSSSGLFGCELG